MKILPLIAIVIVIAVVALGVRTALTGQIIAGEKENNSDTDVSDLNNIKDNSQSDDNNEIETLTSNTSITNVTDEESTSSGGGGGGGSGSGGSSEPDPVPEVCDFIDNDGDGEVDENGCANIYGTIYDVDTNDTLEGINISFYNYTEYNVSDDSGNYSALIPKETPDVVTDVNGTYNISIKEGIYHMIIQGSDEKDFNVHANKTKGNLKHDVELDENRGNHDFNAEGHIIYSGKYEHEGNKYVCGDTVEFVMFGINHGTENETISFVIEDHSINHGVNGDIVYEGNISDESENLIISNGTKEYKEFEFKIPCSFNDGKHDIHVMWNNSKFHKIGNFFVENDTTAPGINTDGSASGMPNENISVGYATWNPTQPGTVTQNIGILEGPDEDLNVTIDKDITEDSDNDTIADNDVDYITTGGSLSYNLTYNESGSYTARFTVTDPTGNTDSEDVNVIIYITEEEAHAIAYSIYVAFGLAPSIDFFNDSNQNIRGENVDVDRWEDNYLFGDEYLTDGDDLGSLNITSMEDDITSCSAGELVKPISPTTAENFNSTLFDYLTHLRDVCSLF